MAELLHLGGALLDHPVVAAAVDGGRRGLGPRHERHPAVGDVPLLPPAGERLPPGGVVVVDVDLPAEQLLEVEDPVLLHDL
jgi:hypothetical protein